MSIKQKIYLLIGALMALLMLLGATGIYSLRSTNEHFRTTFDDRIVPMWELKKIADGYAVTIVDATHKANHGTLPRPQALSRIQTTRADIKSAWQAYLKSSLTPREQQLANDAQVLIQRAELPLDRLEQLLLGNDTAGIDRFARDDLYPLIDPLSDKLTQLNMLQLEVAKQHFDAAKANYQFALIVTAVILLSCLGVAVVMSKKLLITVYRKIDQLHAVMTTVRATKNLRLRAHDDDEDEIDQIAADFNLSLEQQQDIIRSMGEATELFDQVLSILTNTTHEITLVADHSSESAGSLAAVAEEMSTTGAMIAQRASDARELIEQNANAAARGGTQIHRTLERVREIDTALTNAHARLDAFVASVNDLGLNDGPPIENGISQLADSGKKLLRVITDTVHRAHESAALAELADHAIESIVSRLDEEQRVAVELSEALGEQHAGTQLVAHEVEKLSNVAEEHAATLMALKMMTDTMQEISDRMKQHIAQFTC